MSTKVIEVVASNREGLNDKYYIDKTPDSCPRCHHGIHAARHGDTGHVFEKEGTKFLSIVYRCPREACNMLFVATYSTTERIFHQGNDPIYFLTLCEPQLFMKMVVPEDVETLSPGFVRIYNQAAEAECGNLDQIAGPGYRKSLEFLIKDYLIHRTPADEEKLKRTALGNCISHHVADSRIKECASRAVWVGNDETHYIRTVTAADIEDLRRLIRLTVNWIESELLTEGYMKKITKP